MALYTAIAFRKEKDPGQRLANAGILRSLLSYSLLFGENLLVASRDQQTLVRRKIDGQAAGGVWAFARIGECQVVKPEARARRSH